MEEKILDLPLKKEYYCLIESGIKREEYREDKDFWRRRFFENNTIPSFKQENGLSSCNEKGYTHVRFRYGYTKRTMTFKIDDIVMGYGKLELGAPKDKKVFIIKFS